LTTAETYGPFHQRGTPRPRYQGTIATRLCWPTSIGRISHVRGRRPHPRQQATANIRHRKSRGSLRRLWPGPHRPLYYQHPRSTPGTPDRGHRRRGLAGGMVGPRANNPLHRPCSAAGPPATIRAAPPRAFHPLAALQVGNTLCGPGTPEAEGAAADAGTRQSASLALSRRWATASLHREDPLRRAVRRRPTGAKNNPRLHRRELHGHNLADRRRGPKAVAGRGRRHAGAQVGPGLAAGPRATTIAPIPGHQAGLPAFRRNTARRWHRVLDRRAGSASSTTLTQLSAALTKGSRTCG